MSDPTQTTAPKAITVADFEQAEEYALGLVFASSLWTDRDRNTARRVLIFMRAQLGLPEKTA